MKVVSRIRDVFSALKCNLKHKNEPEILKDKQSAIQDIIEKYFPGIADHTVLIFYTVVIVTLICVVSFMTSSLVMSYHEKQETESKIVAMQSFLSEWHEKSNLVNEASARPINNEQIEKVQSSIIRQLKALNLNLQSLKENTINNETNGRNYALVFDGDYNNTIKFLNNFKAYDALLGVKQLKMQIRNQSIQTTLTYKIYIK